MNSHVKLRLEPYAGESQELGKLCLSITDCPHSTPKWTDSGKLVVRSKNIKNGVLSFEQTSYTDPTSFDARNRRATPEPGDLIITREAPMGEVCIIPDGVDCCLGQRMVLLKPDREQVGSEYLLYAILSEYVQKQIKGSDGTGSTVSNLNIPLLEALKIPLLTPQDKIAAILSALDAKIDLNNRINTELEAMAKTLYDYWFVQFDFPDENGHPYKASGGKMVYNKILKRELPERWSNKELSEIANITMGQSPSGESYNENGNGEVFFQGSTDFGWRYPAIRQFTTQPGRMAEQGDILLSVRAPVGTMNIASTNCCIGRGLAALNSKDGFDGFLFYVMEYFKRIFDRRNSEGTTFGSITKDDLFSLKLAYPNSSQLKAYDEIVSKYNEMIFINSSENQQLTQLRDWLLPMLMNSQVTVK